jgi:hypothetical protein
MVCTKQGSKVVMQLLLGVYILTFNLATEWSVLSKEGKWSCICVRGIHFAT